MTMERFSRVLRGYDPEEVNKFLDQVIGHVEKMIASMKEKDKLIVSLQEQNKQMESILKKTAGDRNKINQYERMEKSLNNAIAMAQKTSDQIKVNAHRESQIIIDNAKKNASRIVNEALMKAEKSELEAQRLRRDLNIFKRKMRDLLETQLELVDDMSIDN
jgi:cell division initiation protein